MRRSVVTGDKWGTRQCVRRVLLDDAQGHSVAGLLACSVEMRGITMLVLEEYAEELLMLQSKNPGQYRIFSHTATPHLTVSLCSRESCCRVCFGGVPHTGTPQW